MTDVTALRVLVLDGERRASFRPRALLLAFVALGLTACEGHTSAAGEGSAPTATLSADPVLQVTEGAAQSGLDFPGSAATTGTIRFRFVDPLPMYPATYIWRYWPRSQASYYTTFFWGNDGEFGWDAGRANSYYGAHPYPYPAPNYAPPEQVGPRYWEISVGTRDVLSESTVEYERWHSQALRVWSDWLGRKHHEFYWDLPDTSRKISQTEPRAYGERLPPRPSLTFGDAPWNPSNEILDGVLRGIQVYSSSLTVDAILRESSRPLTTREGAATVWYLKLNPTPEDISDESGAGHHPQWVGTERPRLWRGP